jgi:hypothetical protein
MYEITYCVLMVSSISTDHKHTIHFNDVLPLWHTHTHTQSWYKPITPSNLCKATPWTQQSIQCSTVTLIVQNIATQTAVLGGQNSDPNKLKQPVNMNIAVFSSNQVYVFYNVYGSCFLGKFLTYLPPTNNQFAFFRQLSQFHSIWQCLTTQAPSNAH